MKEAKSLKVAPEIKPAGPKQELKKLSSRSTKISLPRTAMKPGYAKRKGNR